MRRKADPDEVLKGIVRVGTRLVKYPGRWSEERWKVVNVFVHRKYCNRLFVLERWLKRKRRHVYEVETEFMLRGFYGRAGKVEVKS